jgi:hypothetical protein
MPVKAIARRLGLARNTVRTALARDGTAAKNRLESLPAQLTPPTWNMTWLRYWAYWAARRRPTVGRLTRTFWLLLVDLVIRTTQHSLDLSERRTELRGDQFLDPPLGGKRQGQRIGPTPGTGQVARVNQEFG